MTRFRSVRSRAEDMTYDLNLAPMLDIMVALVPFLLLSVVFVRLVVIETPIPQPVAAAVQKDKENKKKSLNIKMYIQKESVILKIVERGRKRNISIKNQSGKYNVKKLHKQLVTLKLKHPNVFSLEILPNESVAYNDIVTLMDAARRTLNGDPKIYITDKKTNKKVETRLMFPNITFGNVVGV